MTAAGLILGTAAYMSPEQARGKTVDRRADVWAFGVVLYEMLTGRSAFSGETVTDVLAAVVTREPDWNALPSNLPPAIRHVLARCLDRDPKTRLRDIGEARVALAKIESGVVDDAIHGVPVAATTGRSARLPWMVTAAMAVVTLITLGLLWFRPAAVPSAAPVAMRFAFIPPEGLTADDLGFDDIVVSPDGTKLVFTAREGNGPRQLWVRSLDALDARALPDTEDAIEPFWSPDSQSVGFGAAGKLKRVDLAGRRAHVLADAARLNNGASWSRTGVILFNPDYGMGLFQVPAGGGAATKVRAPGQGPTFLPDGRHFIYTAKGVFLASLDSDEDVPLPDVRNRAFYAVNSEAARPLAGGATGWLLFVRGGDLVAQPFDAVRRVLVGESTRVATDAAISEGLSEPRRFVSVSETGVMVLMAPQARDYQMVWVDRAGARLGTLGPIVKTVVANAPSISPDGTRAIFQRRDPKTPGQEIWVSDLSRGTLDRVTTGPPNSQMAAWSSDGQGVFFHTVRGGVAGIYAAAATGGDPHLVLKGTVFPSTISSDGRFLLYMQRGQSTRMDVWALPISPAATTAAPSGEPFPVLNSQFEESGAALSPDGRWLAYASDISGADEIYIRRFHGAERTFGDPVRISTGGGTRPRWRKDGTELFYLAAPYGGTRVEMMAVRVTMRGDSPDISTATPLFTTRMVPTALFTDYDVTRDGQRFLVGTVLDGPTVARPGSIVIVNWTAELRR